MMRFIRAVAAVFALGAASVSLLAIFGFASGELDILNHLQIFIFAGTLTGLVLILLLFRKGPMKAALTILAGAGLLASAWVFVPEAVGALLPRTPLPADGRPVLKAMTHNVFGLNDDMDRVAAYVFSEDPDIIALQEYFPEQREPLHALLLPKYPYFAFCTGGKRANIGLYSKLPFTHEDEGACDEQATAAQRTSRIVGEFMLEDGTTFSVLTTHLDWPYPVARQKAQMAELAAAINAINGPLILMGDLNSTPWSYAMRGLTGATALEQHTRNLATYPLVVTVPGPGYRPDLMRLFPFLPLDQVMTRDGVAVHELHAGPDTNSDHLPVVFSFSVEPMTECCLPGG